MPEPDSDKFRASPELPTGFANPNKDEAGVPKVPYIHTTDDEIYQFRKPNVAYMTKGVIHELQDGLQTDGTPPRKWGDTLPEEEQDAKRGI